MLVPWFGDILRDSSKGSLSIMTFSLDRSHFIVQHQQPAAPSQLLGVSGEDVQRGTYLPQTHITPEEMVVTEHVSDKEALGSFIYHLCSGKDTYRLRRRATRRREWPSPPTLAPALSSKPQSS